MAPPPVVRPCMLCCGVGISGDDKKVVGMMGGQLIPYMLLVVACVIASFGWKHTIRALERAGGERQPPGHDIWPEQTLGKGLRREGRSLGELRQAQPLVAVFGVDERGAKMTIETANLIASVLFLICLGYCSFILTALRVAEMRRRRNERT